jgi:hypothetical protein
VTNWASFEEVAVSGGSAIYTWELLRDSWVACCFEEATKIEEVDWREPGTWYKDDGGLGSHNRGRW